MRFRFVPLACAAMLLPSLATVAGAADTDVAPLYGQWAGTWFVTEQFTGDNLPYNAPPYPSVTLGLTLHANDSLNDFFGPLSVQGGASGQMTGLTRVDSAINMIVTYPTELGPNNYGTLVGTLSGNTITGTFNEASPATPGKVHWRGTFTLTQVPEPAAAAAIALAALPGLLRRRRRR